MGTVRNGLLILTDVPGVAKAYNTQHEQWIKTVSPDRLAGCKEDFPEGSMGPKVESAIEFVKKTGGWAAIGSLNARRFQSSQILTALCRMLSHNLGIVYYEE
jgi:carbamate kinase